MSAAMAHRFVTSNLWKFSTRNNVRCVNYRREFCSSETTSDSQINKVSDRKNEESGLAKTFQMFQAESEKEKKLQVKKEDPRDTYSFAKLLRTSTLIQMGDMNGRLVIGTIIQVLDDSLYIDFGGKFYCVCRKPSYRSSEYRQGQKVRLRLHDPEMCARFLGATRDNTLLEADATLLGLMNKMEPVKTVKGKQGANTETRKDMEDISGRYKEWMARKKESESEKKV